MMKRKLTIIGIISAAIVAFILVMTQIPSTNPNMKDLPIAVVNNDKGKLGNQVVTQIKKVAVTSATKKASLKVTEVRSNNALKKAMNSQHYYGAIVLPSDFSKQATSLISAAPKSSTVKVIINQGLSVTIANQLRTMLPNMVNNLGKGLSAQVLTTAGKQSKTIPITTATALINPVKVKTTMVHKVGTIKTGNASFFQPIWVASLIAALILWYADPKFKSRQKEFVIRLEETGWTAITAIAIGIGTPLFQMWLLNFQFDNFWLMSAFLSITSFTFITLITGVTNVLGRGGLPIFGLLLFFGAPLMTLIPQMIPTFYRHWIMPWLPIQFLYNGAKNILFYGSGLWNNATTALIVIMLIGLLLNYAELGKKKYTTNLDY